MRKKKQTCASLMLNNTSILVYYLHELKRSFKVLHRVHFDPEEFHAHDKADDALNHMRTLLFLPELLQFSDELFPHCLKPEHNQNKATP